MMRLGATRGSKQYDIHAFMSSYVLAADVKADDEEFGNQPSPAMTTMGAASSKDAADMLLSSSENEGQPMSEEWSQPMGEAAEEADAEAEEEVAVYHLFTWISIPHGNIS